MVDFVSIGITLLTILGGGAIWKYLEKRLNYKLEERKIENKEDFMHINDLRNRIEKLEKLLRVSADEKDELRNEIIRLTAETATMKTEIEYLAKENQLLRKLIGADSTEPKKTPTKKRTRTRKTNEKKK